MTPITVHPAAAMIALGAAVFLGWFACAALNGRDAERFDTARRQYEQSYTDYLAVHEPTEQLPVVRPRLRVRVGPQLRAWAADLREGFSEWLDQAGPDRREGWTPATLAAARSRFDPGAVLTTSSMLPAMPTPQQLRYHLARHVPRELRIQRAKRWAR